MTLSNNPPPEAAIGLAIEDLYVEASAWLDGSPLETQEQADTLGRIVATARDLHKDADKTRAAEKKPHDDAARAVQAKWKPLLDKADKITTVGKAALARFLAAQQAEQDRIAAAAQAEADRLAEDARIMAMGFAPDDLAAQEALKATQDQAQKAAKQAAFAAKQTAKVAGTGRAIGLRTYYVPTLTNPVEALAFYKKNRPDALKAFLLELAQQDVSAGLRSIPGFDIKEEKRAA